MSVRPLRTLGLERYFKTPIAPLALTTSWAGVHSGHSRPATQKERGNAYEQLTAAAGQGVSTNVPPAGTEISTRNIERARWASKSTAQFVSGSEFQELKELHGLHVIGVVGFSGQWSDQKIEADPSLRSDAEAGAAVLREFLTQAKQRHGSRLVVSSGATMEGVPKIIYSLCEELGIEAMGVTSAKAYDYALGKMRYLIVEGEDWGQESATFLRTSDEIIMMGGGGQAKREAIAASTEGKPVTIFQGFKGTADQLTQEDVKGATFLARH